MSNVALPLNVYGYAAVNADGTTSFKSPNLTVTAQGSGVYNVGLGNRIASGCLPVVTGAHPGASGINFSASVDVVPNGISTNDEIVVTTQLAGTPTNEAFFLIVYSVGPSAIASTP